MDKRCFADKQAVLTRNLGQEEPYYDDQYGGQYGDQYGGHPPGPYSPSPEPPSGYLPPQQNAGYPPQQQNYQNAPFFPPPPTGERVYAPNEPYPTQQQQQAAYPPYNPADYAQGGAQPHPYGATRGAYGESDATLGQPYPNDTFAGDPRYAAETPPHDGRGRGREPPENVSAPVNVTSNSVDDARDAQDAGTSVPRRRT